MQKLNLSNQINIAMGKFNSHQLLSGILICNFNEKIRESIASDEAFTFMSSIKGTSAYWKKFNIFPMVKQLGVPTFLITLSADDFKWNELVSIINKLHKLQIFQKRILRILSFHGQCRLLNSNPVLVVRHFQ